MPKVCLIRQPAGLGDIMFCQKIADHFKSMDYDIIWPVIKEFYWLKNYIKEIDFPLITDNFFGKQFFLSKQLINTSDFLFLPLQDADQFFPAMLIMDSKYKMANLSYENWQKFLIIERNTQKENELYTKLNPMNESYIFVNKNYGSPPGFKTIGHIPTFNIQQLINDFKLSHYIETGTGEGLTLSHALTFDFKTLHSIELDKYMYDIAIQKFKNTRLTIYFGLSRNILPLILHELKDENILFFLDAHFPGSDFKTGPNYIESVKIYDHDALPLKDELEIILKLRPQTKDIFIIDDLRIYEDDNYETGNWKERKKLNIENSSFIYNLFKKTHTIQKDLRQQGYLLIKPYEF